MVSEKILGYLPERLRKAVAEVNTDITEIRIRRERPLVIMQNNKMYFLAAEGDLNDSFSNSCITVSAPETESVFYSVCRNSVHSFQEDICNGFITIEGGHRVGLCGTAVTRDGRIQSVKDINGLNIRISREIIGSGEDIYNRVFCCGLKNVLIAGAPSSGKTTILRDLCRLLGDKYRVSIIDERSELAAVCKGVPQNNIGINSDIFDRFSKQSGLETAVRVMSPDIIVFDEAGSENEFEYIRYAMTCGVRICASIHAFSVEDVRRKLAFTDDFNYIVMLDPIAGQGVKIYRTDDL